MCVFMPKSLRILLQCCCLVQNPKRNYVGKPRSCMYRSSQKIGTRPSSNDKPRKAGQPAYIILHPCSNFLESILNGLGLVRPQDQINRRRIWDPSGVTSSCHVLLYHTMSYHVRIYFYFKLADYTKRILVFVCCSWGKRIFRHYIPCTIYRI